MFQISGPIPYVSCPESLVIYSSLRPSSSLLLPNPCSRLPRSLVCHFHQLPPAPPPPKSPPPPPPQPPPPINGPGPPVYRRPPNALRNRPSQNKMRKSPNPPNIMKR